MNDQIAHSEACAVAVIMIVVASWFLYRYLAPKTWREWAGAGLVQAFIIALYAEMYGFPLTICLLVRWFGLDRDSSQQCRRTSEALESDRTRREIYRELNPGFDRSALSCGVGRGSQQHGVIVGVW